MAYYFMVFGKLHTATIYYLNAFYYPKCFIANLLQRYSKNQTSLQYTDESMAKESLKQKIFKANKISFSAEQIAKSVFMYNASYTRYVALNTCVLNSH